VALLAAEDAMSRYGKGGRLYFEAIIHVSPLPPDISRDTLREILLERGHSQDGDRRAALRDFVEAMRPPGENKVGAMAAARGALKVSHDPA